MKSLFLCIFCCLILNTIRIRAQEQNSYLAEEPDPIEAQSDPLTGKPNGYINGPVNQNKFDSKIDPKSDKRIEPTNDPSIDPEIHPTNDPSIEQTIGPFIDPMTGHLIEQKINEKIASVFHPKNDPTIGHLIDPMTGHLIEHATVTKVESINDTSIDHLNEETIDQLINPSANKLISLKIDPKIESTIYPKNNPLIEPIVDQLKVQTIGPIIDTSSGQLIVPTIDSEIDPSLDPTADQLVDETIGPLIDPTSGQLIVPTIDPTIESKIESEIKTKIDSKFNPTVEESDEIGIEPEIDTFETTPKTEAETTTRDIWDEIINGDRPKIDRIVHTTSPRPRPIPTTIRLPNVRLVTSGQSRSSIIRQRLRSLGNRIRTRVQKKFMDIRNFDLKQLDIRNMTQFTSFFQAFGNLFHKNYSNEGERKTRQGFFRRAIESIRNHNKNVRARYRQGINELSDMSLSEIVKYKLGYRPDLGDKMLKASFEVPHVEQLPEEWDWRKFGIVTIPRNQGKCGSCWSFAASTVLESHNMKRQIAEGKFDPNNQITVSEQNLIDCSSEFGTIGCEGGMPQQAFRYVKANGGVNGIDYYPYTGKKDQCKYDFSKRVDVTVDEGRRLKTGMDEDLVTAIYNYGPIAIAIHVTKDMAAYKTGIFDDPKCDAKKVNHAVVVVGYAKEYFIVRNSWGPKWGEGGYIRVARSKINNCGISQQGYFPIVPDSVETKDMVDKLVVLADY